MLRRLFITIAVATLFCQFPASAQQREVPYWATIKTERLNMRVGPSRQYRIAWVYKRIGLPVKIIRVVEAWRLVEDMDGTRGWVSANLLSPELGGMVSGKQVAKMRAGPDAASALKWNLAPGVIGNLGECERGWCELEVRGHRGWVRRDRLWGAASLDFR